MSLEGARKRYETTHAQLVEAIETMPSSLWRLKVAGADGKPRPFFELLGSIVGAPKRPFGHAFAHLDDLPAK